MTCSAAYACVQSNGTCAPRTGTQYVPGRIWFSGRVSLTFDQRSVYTDGIALHDKWEEYVGDRGQKPWEMG